jgi:FkbM family methyltransferase
MSVKGITRYQRLTQNIANWQEYIFRKGERKKRSLQFTTRPYPIHFKVPGSLYQVFKEIFMEDFYEIDSLVKKLPDNPVIIDVGANAGFFNILLFSKIHKARILAYEPMPSNIAFFKDAIDRNPILQSIKLYQAAVTGKPKEYIELFTEDTEGNTVVSSVFSNFNQLNNKKVRVEARSLSSIIAGHKLEQVDLLKLDCEGSEYDIIYNTDPSILARVKMMVIEVHQIDRDQHNLNALDRYLTSMGYKNKILPVQEGSFYMEAIKK